jgi:non-ribosomal peptide synthase protein (TIGR01720 family)
VVPADGTTVDVDALRAFLSARLPAHMVPTAWAVLDALPLSPTGKVDRRALPAPDAPTAAEVEAAMPHGEVEETLARVWCDVLRVERVGVHENFFSLGGDSILAIQMMARAGRSGIRLTPRQVFENPTVAGLARVAGTEPTVRAEQGPVTGDAPLAPVQAWLLEQALPSPQHWNMPAMFELRRRVDPAAVSRALEALATHHDALRMRFVRGADGWRQHNAAPAVDALPLEQVDLSGVADAELSPAIEAYAASAQTSLDLERGPVARGVLFDCGAARPQRLLLVVHHLVVDAVSWPILSEDLESALVQAAAGEPIAFPRKTTSFREWAERLDSHARSSELRAEAAYWAAAVPADAVAVPVDDPAAPDMEETTDAVFAELDAEETRALLADVPAAYRTQINDALLAALVQAFGVWAGRPSLVVQMEGHGREDLFSDVDVTRTVGWFTSAFPVHLEADPAAGPGAVLTAVKERLRAVPGRGIGHGILRHRGDAAVADVLRAQPHPQVSFNYLGQTDGVRGDDDALLAPAADPTGPPRAPDAPRPYRIQVDGAVADGRLRMGFYFGGRAYARATMERLAEAYGRALRELIEHCRDPQAGGYTPSDFALAELDQEGLDSLLSQLE